MKAQLDYDILECPVDEPIVFTGPPRRLVGRLPIHNAGSDRAVLRHATFRGGALEQEMSASVRTTVLRPSTGVNLRARVAMTAHTAPGDYPCEVEIGGSIRPVLLRVVEVINVAVQPSVLLIENRPGSRPTKRIIVTNRGNVPITVGHPGGIALDDERGECRVTRATFEALGRALDADEQGSSDRQVRRPGDVDGPVLTLERAFGEWVRQGRSHLADMGVLGVRNRSGPTTVAPGEQATIELSFRIPKGLDQHTRFIGIYPLYDTDISFVIVPGPGDDDRSEEDDDAQRA